MIDVVLPVLDERLAIPWVLGRMPKGFSPLVVDNGSTDGSGALAEERGAHVVREPTPGFGAACWTGLEAATTDVVCFMDCDGSLDPAELPRVVEQVVSGEADLVLGERIAAPGAWPVHARVANRVIAFEVRRRTGLVVRDLGPMRAARRLSLVRLGIEDRRSGWPLEMVLRAIRAGWRIHEVPVGYARRDGRSKVTGTVKGTARAISDMRTVLGSLR